MALAAVKTFVAAEVLYASDLNALNTNILNNALTLVSPWTATMQAGGFSLTGLSLGSVGSPSVSFTSDANTGLYSTGADTVDIATGGARAASFGASSLIAAAPEDARTNTVDVVHEFRSTTSGVPAANIGTGVLFTAESADETPSDFGRLDFVATDITAASEDTVLDINLRTAGAALGPRYRFQSLGAFLYTFTGTPTANRTITLPDSSITLGAGGGSFTWVGGTATEASTTSVADVSLVTISGLSIAVTSPFLVICNHRKTSGAAVQTKIGLMLNATDVVTTFACTTTTNEAQSGVSAWLILPHDATYLRVIGGFAAGAGTNNTTFTWAAQGNIPNATITSVIIRAATNDAAVTMGVQSVNVYTLAVS